ncbi:dihydrodipicolinate synthase family protein [Actinobacteria bacterium YIM 96077]|uniref:Dihydrodipicolinate synthase family protein n=1 Tax=Phytoactinopolyspora halophila TaxID=1981511 RepID=A0A329QV94_9ACTN|nr:dihydrodipicolinate synthase family protein [Phytoactinopolyspora halophila]AYY13909.1 dihydrodipicolinate synthase family protein [Actinobacteria bacterium YIM 96077]RAW15549.1 dihydrodipicolinate synthase family protein [Phytoactinopolyspora halophila]
MTTITLPTPDGGRIEHALNEPRDWPKPQRPFRSRVAFAAAHVVAHPLADNTPGTPAALDWDSTLAFRRHLWSHGLGVAEAMDTAQRGMGMDWPATRELIRRSAAEAASAGTRIAAGAGTDQLDGPATTLDEVVAAYEEQIGTIQDAGAQVIIMASRHLAALARSVDDYRAVYDRVLAQVDSPVILHWLGPAFDPALQGYWGSDDVDVATGHVVDLVRDHASMIDGVKVSLLDADHEKAFRAQLPAGVRLYTGDDFNYPELIRGDGAHHSDALLGVFAAIAPAASAALQALDDGDDNAYDAAFAPTLPLARHIFGAPTYYYKTGVAFLSWLSGFQAGFTMVGGLQSARSLPHLVEAFRLADAARLFPDPELAAARMTALLETYGTPPPPSR